MKRNKSKLIFILLIAFIMLGSCFVMGFSFISKNDSPIVKDEQSISSALAYSQSNDPEELADYTHAIVYGVCSNLTGADLTAVTGQYGASQGASANYRYFYNIEASDVITLYDVETISSAGTNYIFEGWYLDAAAINPISQVTGNSFNSNVEKGNSGVYVSAIYVYAKWSKHVTYTLTYHLAAGATHTNPASFASWGSPITLVDPTVPADTGSAYYVFDGWYATNTYNVDSQLETITEEIAEQYASNNEVHIYAKINTISYDKITLVLDGNTVSNAVYDTSANTVKMGDVTLYSDTSDGGYDISSSSSPYKLFKDNEDNLYMKRTESMGNIDIYKITATKDTLYYNSDINKPLTSYTSNTTTTAIQGSLGTYTTSWYSTTTLVGKARIGQYSGSDTVKLKWTETAEGYSIEYVLNGGRFQVNDAQHTYYYPTYFRKNNSPSEISDAVKDQDGYVSYVFEGWYRTYYEGDEETPSSYSNPLYNNSQIATLSSNTTLYAKWSYSYNEYSITYNLNSGTNSLLNPATHSTDVTLSSPTRDPETIEGITYRYAFAGWYANSSFTGDPVTVAKAVDLEIWAKWVRYKVYGVEYHYNGGVPVDGKTYPSTYSIADGVVAIPDPTRLSTDSRITYIFLGWFIGSSAAGEVYNNNYLIGQLDSNVEDRTDHLADNYDYDTENAGRDGDIDLYAGWQVKPDTFAIEYVLGTPSESEMIVNNKKNPTYVSSLNNARVLYTPTRVKYTYNSNGTIGIKTWPFIGWFSAATGEATQYTELYYTMGELTVYARWGSPTSYTFTPGTAVRVNENMQLAQSGGYILYGTYPQTKIDGLNLGNSDGDYTSNYVKYKRYEGEYYRYEPVMWKYIGTGYVDGDDNIKYLYMSTLVLDGGSYGGDTNFMSIDSVSDTRYRPLKEDIENLSEADMIKAGSDYAESKGITIDDKMGTAAYWLQDLKDVSSSGAAIDDTTANQISSQGLSFRYYVSARGEVGYTQSTRTTIGTAPVLCLSSMVTKYTV